MGLSFTALSHSVSRPQDDPYYCSLSHSLGDAFLFSRKSVDSKTENEDAVSVIENQKALILSVADGVSGQRMASMASQSILQELHKRLSKRVSRVRNCLIDSIELANQKIHRKGRGAGTTLASVEITADYIRPYIVGDSSVFLVGQKGKLRYRSIAHSPVGYALASGLIAENEALSHEESHLLMNAIGGIDLNIELGPFLEYQSTDRLLICSDGLTDCLPQDSILEVIRKGEPEEALQTLIEMVEARQKEDPSLHDDLSLILFRPRK
ncbi:MAG: serine/threonine-protein phosphatase [Bradymonadales bacterium]|nr:MAG: serine/threonine-protein phosphatase [Bradymonadales bacterium]